MKNDSKPEGESKPKTSKLALILTIVGVACWFIPVVGKFVAIFVWLACYRRYRDSEVKSEKLFSSISQILSIVNIVVVAVVFFLWVLSLLIICLCCCCRYSFFLVRSIINSIINFLSKN